MQTKPPDLGEFGKSGVWMNFANDMILIQSDKRVRACDGGLVCIVLDDRYRDHREHGAMVGKARQPEKA